MSDEFYNNVDKHKDTQIDEKTQAEINKPLKKEEGLSESEKTFLNKILELIEKKKINFDQTSSIINQDVYEKLSPEHQVKVEMRARVALQNIRRIKDLYDHPEYDTESHQMSSMLAHLYQEVETLEEAEGDVFKI